MKCSSRGCMLAIAAMLLAALVGQGLAEDKTPSSLPSGEVTIRGAFQCNGLFVPEPKAEDHALVIVAVEGSDEINAMVKKVMDEYYPDKGLDAAAAQKLDKAFADNLKFFYDAESPAKAPPGQRNPGPKHYCHCASACEMVGTLYEKDGKKFIKATKLTEGVKIKYPEKMMMADKPFEMPDKQPLVLKINDTVSINMIKVPAGKAYMGEQCYVPTRYLEQFPRVVTLTKGFYASEIPITQEIWEAVMGDNPNDTKDLKLPFSLGKPPSAPNAEKFCKALSEKTGKAIRLLTGSEWEYIARCGTSNPGFPEKYAEQGDRESKITTVKSLKPNAWGFYDLVGPWWELTSDKAKYPSHHDEVDPSYPAAPNANRVLMGVVGKNWTLSLREFEDYSGYTSRKFRIGMDAEGPTSGPAK